MDYPKRTEKYDGADPFTLSPGGSTYPDNPHEGEEFGYVLLGSITLVYGNAESRSKKGNPFISRPIPPIIYRQVRKPVLFSSGSAHRPAFN